jgi:hypothetical protein
MKHTSLGPLVCLFAVNGCNAVIDPGTDPGTGLTPGADSARVRVAHLSPDAPAVDFCIAPAGTKDFAGPVLGGAGAPLGISYGNVTKYLDVEATRYDVRLVAPGAADCNRALVPDVTDLPELPAGASATIAATGKLDHDGTGESFALRAYIDDDSVPAGQAKLRFIHASPGTPPVDVGLGGGALFKPVFPNIPYGRALTDGNGYVTTPPFTGAEISARLAGTLGDVLSITPAALPAGAIATAFAIGQVDNAKAPLGVLLCLDNSPAHGIETECSIVGAAPSRARIRVAHLSPDAPAVDVCLKTAGGAYDRPVLASLGASGGLQYPQVTTYVELPTARYDLRIVRAGDPGGCANAAVADTAGVAIDKGVTATVAAIGVLDRSGAAAHDPGFRLAVFADATATTAGKGKLRFIHASPGTPAVDVGLGVGHGFQRVFANVSFSNLGTNAPLDSLGYIEASPFTAPVTARLAGATTDALTVPSVTLAAGQIATAFAIGNKTGSAANPLRVLLCDDRKSAGLLTACVTAP